MALMHRGVEINQKKEVYKEMSSDDRRTKSMDQHGTQYWGLHEQILHGIKSDEIWTKYEGGCEGGTTLKWL